MTGPSANPIHPRWRLALQILPWALLLLILVALFTPNLQRSRMMVSPSTRPYESAAGKTGIAADLEAPAAPEARAARPAQAAFDRKIIRTGSMELVVKDAPAAAQQLQALAERLGGYIESSSLNQVGDTMNGTVKLRVPAASFDQARAGARGIGLRVQSESIEATDVTRQFVDLEASLRNFRAEEAQYLEIMKRSGKIEEVLQVAEHLADVRGRIERTQSELNLLSHQVDMSTLTVTLVAQAEARVLGLEWRPLYNARRTLRDMLEGLSGWVDAVVALVIYLPLILVWTATILFFLVVAWKLVRFVWKRFFSRPPAAPPA